MKIIKYIPLLYMNCNIVDYYNICGVRQKQQQINEGYSTSMVDAHKYSHTAHHIGPLPLELVWLAQLSVDAGVQEANHCCGDKGRGECRAGKQEATALSQCRVYASLVVHLTQIDY